MQNLGLYITPILYVAYGIYGLWDSVVEEVFKVFAEVKVAIPQVCHKYNLKSAIDFVLQINKVE